MELPIPSRQSIELQYGLLALVEFLAVLAWISFTRNKKILYILFTLPVLFSLSWSYGVEYYYVQKCRPAWYHFEGHLVLAVILLLAPVVYYFLGKKPWVYWGTNILVFLGAINKEILEVVYMSLFF